MMDYLQGILGKQPQMPMPNQTRGKDIHLPNDPTVGLTGGPRLDHPHMQWQRPTLHDFDAMPNEHGEWDRDMTVRRIMSMRNHNPDGFQQLMQSVRQEADANRLR